MKFLYNIFDIFLTRLLTALIFISFAANCSAQTTQIIPALPSQTGDGDVSALFFQQLRLQTVYGTNFFPNGPITIYEIRFQRQKGTLPFTNVTINARIAMSTTLKSADGLSTVFANNLGSDEVVVFNGSVAVTSSNAVTTNPATSPFDIVIPLTTPFSFDPSRGNLLVDYTNPNGFIPTGILGVTVPGDKASRMFSLSATSPSGASDSAAEAIQLVSFNGSSGDIVVFPNGGGFTNSVKVSFFSRLTGGQIRYTVDGTTPTVASTLYTNLFTLTETSTVNARYFVNGFPASDIYSANFTKADPILFNPGSTLFTNSLQITLTNTLGNGVIRYTVDGSAPTFSSPQYSNPIIITNATTVSAQLYLNNFSISQVFATNYSRVYAFGNDGISVAWRQQNFGPGYLTDPRSEASADPDNDGSTNLQEFNAGTNPLDPNSGFRIGIRP
ncbi:MAG: glycoside hydrolase family 18, partial [Verrucomicrobiales bacterium]|nr:glycoside hydrolase family 18 [Verrucomicrobiales bacterium]